MLNKLSVWWDRIGLQLRLHILIQGCLIVILIGVQLWTANLFEQQKLIAAKAEATTVADGTINGLNTLMTLKLGKDDVISDKKARAQFIDKMGKSEKVRELRIIRAKQLDTEFPQGLPEEYPVDDMDRSVLANGKTEFKMIMNDNGEALLRTVVPFIAIKEFRGINCLKCHSVDEGYILGAASITIDVKDDLAGIKKVTALFWVGQGILQIILYSIIGLIVRRLAMQLGGEPAYVIDIVNQIAKGNLSQQIATRMHDSTSLLAKVKQMQEKRKQAEEALEEQRVEMETILRHVLVGIVYLKNRIIISCNRGMEEIFGYEPGELLGKTTEVLYDTHETFVEIGHRAYSNLASLNRYNEELKLRHKDESIFWGSLTGRALDPMRPQEGSIWIYTDITERKYAEAELDQHRHRLEELVFARTAELAAARDAAEAASRAKSIFLANMSHELRTPMNGVMGMTDLALRRATDPQQIDWLNTSKGSAQRLLGIINDVLDISQIEAQQLVLEDKDFFLSQVFDDVAQMQGAAAQAKGLGLSCEISPALPDLLCGDATRLKQVLINYIGNAIKFSQHGQITMRARAIEEDSHSVLLRIEVTDQGIGFSPEQQARLFQAFSQVDGSSNRKYGGTGLGLIICKRLALLMGGEVGADSTPGEGSTFWFAARLQRGHGILPAGKTPDTDKTINRAVAPDAVADSSAECAPDPGRAQEVLEQLEPLLVRGDFMSGELFESNRPLLLGTLGAEAMRLGQQIAAFDYETALTTLREMAHR